VLDERPAERSAWLELAERLLLGFEVALRIQLFIPAEQNAAAAEDVRAALGDDVHHTARRSAELGAVPLRRDLVFLNRFRGKLLQQAAYDAVIVVATIDRDLHRSAGHPAVADAADLGLRRVVVIGGARAGHEQRQI